MRNGLVADTALGPWRENVVDQARLVADRRPPQPIVFYQDGRKTQLWGSHFGIEISYTATPPRMLVHYHLKS